jgi:hypothetical protein
MDLFPQDLGGRWHTALVRARLPQRHAPFGGARLPVDEFAEPPLPSARVGPLGRFWAGGTDADDAATARGLSAVRSRTGPMTTGLGIGAAAALLVGSLGALLGNAPELAVLTGAEAAFLGSIGLFAPRVIFGRVHRRPLRTAEIEALLPTCRDDLDRSFLTLAIDAARQHGALIPDEAKRDVRRALGVLADAIEQLPAGSTAPNESADDLRREAERVRAEAGAETDPVGAASLERQADALARRADSLARSATLVRRASILRRELVAQIEALRAGLVGFQTGATDITGLAGLAESVRGVAAEAASVAQAREELDAAVLAPPAALVRETAPEPPLRVGAGGGG